MTDRIVAFTGHRPNKLPGGWNGDGGKLAEWLGQKLFDDGVKYVIVGGALGIDQIAMQAAKMAGCHITLIEPFPGFWRKWPEHRIEEYMELKYSTPKSHIKMMYADEEESYSAWKMQKRNQDMVDRATEVWAYWDGSQGGTCNCVRYAVNQGKQVRNLFDEYNPENQI